MTLDTTLHPASMHDRKWNLRLQYACCLPGPGCDLISPLSTVRTGGDIRHLRHIWALFCCLLCQTAA